MSAHKFRRLGSGKHLGEVRTSIKSLRDGAPKEQWFLLTAANGKSIIGAAELYLRFQYTSEVVFAFLVL